MLTINDNLGVIVDYDYLNINQICAFEKKDLAKSNLFNLIKSGKFTTINCELKDKQKILKGARFVDESKSDLEEAKLSVKIAKFNCKLNPNNNFYLQQLDLAQNNLNKFIDK